MSEKETNDQRAYSILGLVQEVADVPRGYVGFQATEMDFQKRAIIIQLKKKHLYLEIQHSCLFIFINES